MTTHNHQVLTIWKPVEALQTILLSSVNSREHFKGWYMAACRSSHTECGNALLAHHTPTHEHMHLCMALSPSFAVLKRVGMGGSQLKSHPLEEVLRSHQKSRLVYSLSFAELVYQCINCGCLSLVHDTVLLATTPFVSLPSI